MRKKTSREERESALASGWTVEAEPDREAAEAAPRSGGARGSGAADAAIAAPATDPDPRSGIDRASEQDAGAAATVEDDAVVEERAQLSNGALVVLGVLGGLYLLYTWVWLSWAQYYSGVNEQVASASGSLGGVLQLIVFWAAPFAPALWFFSVLALNRGASTLKLAIWILVGAVVLFPLPLLSGGAA